MLSEFSYVPLMCAILLLGHACIKATVSRTWRYCTIATSHNHLLLIL